VVASRSSSKRGRQRNDMAIELFHVGEVLTAEILSRLQARGILHQICAVSREEGEHRTSLADDFRTAGVELPAKFVADSASVIARFEGQSFSCDGAQTVDVLCAGRNDRSIAIEIKLGETRMATGDFRKRFCVSCEKSRHLDSRLRGSMVAVLDRALPFPGEAELDAQFEHRTWSIGKEWWLVVRRRVWRSWRSSPVRNGRVAIFEDLAKIYGSPQDFDELVAEVVGSDFANRWAVYE